MPPEVVARINQAMAKAAEDKSLREQINATGCEVEFLSPLQTVEKIKLDLAKWGKVVKDANIKAE
jgi:tripartite-type tricarboxylate transporter receptor subunit TctC